MLVVDSSVWITNFRGARTEPVRKLASYAPQSGVLVGDVVLLELLQGARSAGDAIRIERSLRNFAIVPMLSPAPAVEAAANYRLPRSLGITIRKMPDLIIGTTASSTVIPCCTTTATSSRCACISGCRSTDGHPAAVVSHRGRVPERYFAVTAHSWLCTSPSSSPRCTSIAGAPSWNCAASVLPDSAVVEDCPPETAVATASKYPTPTSRW
jgi:predicted nucleic acid-binding protein